jgi:hypothetical protein
MKIKEEFKLKSFEKSNNIKNKEMKNRILKNNINKANDKIEFFHKQFNISILSNDEFKKYFDLISYNYPSNMTLENYTLLIQKNYFLLNLLEDKFIGKLYSNNSLDENKFYDNFKEFISSHFTNLNYSDLVNRY